jgi:hypothetical protein
MRKYENSKTHTMGVIRKRKPKTKTENSQMMVAHACNLSYSGGRAQEDRGWKPARANSSRDPILKKTFTKIGLVEWLKVKALTSSPSTAKKQNKTEKQFGMMITWKPMFCSSLWSPSSTRRPSKIKAGFSIFL